ncbi:MAG TPA: tRNA (N(6)-L-threonylcarbamoyladenosine(37)-C(2))-methylthiotransferase MtaB [Candidatus Scatomonas pullistercoris]|uniref:Threonylcarbamoyladenosine tRNA methylthiotransferase MtaB n=1 Tax=Candidatus Scatomonas pullistercoris TaxID=2840920 RepID=A0A9D1P399_9FIRM|nr:tRNA (N(6)-L-threonylcarbamoyladenosine(37)-C(2))-methylthiotransferase MtaB [Candidatus Scatomonas pullistercoris]
MCKKVALHNLGCKVNAYELEAMEQLLEKKGYEIVPFEPGADYYIINTCTVTNIADRKSRQMLHRARKMNPEAVVAAVGCYAQIRGEELEKDPMIDLIVGNSRKGELPQLLQSCRLEKKKQAALSDLGRERKYEPLSIEKTAEHTRAFIKVQDGCNQFCSYCIIPYARGRVRSRRPEDVLREVRNLAASGCREVVLSGIHLSSYGIDFEQQTDLLDLIRLLHPVEGIDRIRLGSLEPGIITEGFAEELAALPKVCPHFHLSLQSGCDRTLRRMNRRYTSGEYLERCRILRKYFRDPALTTDIITGFPGETEEDFRESAEFVERVSFFETHVFPYSRREGTRAASMEGQLPEAVKKQRSHVLLELNKRKKAEYLEKALGKETEVLLEEETELDGRRAWAGYTREYRKVLVLSDRELGNTLQKVCPEQICRGEFLLCR